MTKDKDMYDYLRQLIKDSAWDGRGMLVSQDAWREYLTWALDEMDKMTMEQHPAKRKPKASKSASDVPS